MTDVEPAVVTLDAARGLVGTALDEASAAPRVSWDSPAAERFRARAADLTRVLLSDLDTLDQALRQVRGLE